MAAQLANAGIPGIAAIRVQAVIHHAIPAGTITADAAIVITATQGGQTIIAAQAVLFRESINILIAERNGENGRTAMRWMVMWA